MITYMIVNIYNYSAGTNSTVCKLYNAILTRHNEGVACPNIKTTPKKIFAFNIMCNSESRQCLTSLRISADALADWKGMASRRSL